MGRVKAVIYWPTTEQVSIEDLELLNVEDRYRDAVTTVKTKDNKLHKAIVRLISSNYDLLQAEEEKVSEEIEAREQAKQPVLTDSEKKGRKTRQRRKAGVDEASERQVASAFGERAHPAPHQAAQAKALAQQKKAANQAFLEAQAEVDQQVLREVGPKRQLFGDTAEVETDGELDEHSDDDIYHDDKDNDCDDIDEINDGQEAGTSKCCSHCIDLQKALTKSPTVFIKGLAQFTNIAGVGVQYVDMLPIPENVPKCELSKGHGIFISVHDKNQIKEHGNGDPSKMTRMGLIALYGKEALEKEEVTALGTKLGTKGIKKKERDALLAFVNRNVGPTYQTLKSSAFHRVINRKKGQVHRSKTPRSTPKSRGGNPQKRSSHQQPKSKSRTVKSPAKPSPRKVANQPGSPQLQQTSQSPRMRNSPAKQLSPRKLANPQRSPRKVKSTPVKAAVAWDVSDDSSRQASPVKSNSRQDFQQYAPQNYQGNYDPGYSGNASDYVFPGNPNFAFNPNGNWYGHQYYEGEAS